MADRTDQRRDAKDLLRSSIYQCLEEVMREHALSMEDAIGVLETVKLSLWHTVEEDRNTGGGLD